MRKRWWKESVVYQIYPRSFYDSNGDGIGDLRGIIAKLDYLQALGVDVVWLSPFYASPNVDNGYDVSDYCDILPDFGKMADWQHLRQEMRRRGMRMMIDLVANHTSDQHRWFIESRQATDNRWREYYIWRPPRDGREPNNWQSYFGGSAWQFDPTTAEYYLHLFSRQQPDLNWENADVRKEIYRVMHWWLDQGVDGFRLDVINLISKEPGLPDAAVTVDGPYQFGGQHFQYGPRLLEFLAEMKREVLAGRDLITVGETPGITTEQARAITDEENGFLNMVFSFEHLGVDRNPRGVGKGKWQRKAWKLSELKQIISRWQDDLHERAWNSVYLSNHDLPRPVSRFGDDCRYRDESAKMLATLLHTLQGTPYIYQGEEIGMTNVRFPSINDYRDVDTLNFYRQFADDQRLDRDEIMAAIYDRSRDNARTPMQWDGSRHAGFATVTPWLAVNPNYPEINVQRALAEPNSILHYYRQLIRLRKANPVLVYGRYELLLADDEQIYAFTRTLGETRLLVVLNFCGAESEEMGESGDWRLPEAMRDGQLLIGNYPVDPAVDPRRCRLRPYEARVYRLG